MSLTRCSRPTSARSHRRHLNDGPIDVLAERLNSTRGALYKTLHDARRKLRRRLVADGFGEDIPEQESVRALAA